MTTIFAKTTDQVLVATQLPRVACNNQNTVKLHVDFDSVWDGYVKSAVFYTSKDPTVYEIILSTDGNCIVPAEVLIEDATLFIGVRGIKTASKEVKSSTLVKYRVLAGTPSVVISDPAPNVYQQLLMEYVATRKELAVERARVNTLLEAGTIEYGEVADIRVGVDGTTYPSAGDAVREQIKNENAKIDHITKPSFNMFDKTKVKKDAFLNYGKAGELLLVGFFISDYMPCEGNTLYSATYEKGNDFNIHTYDIDKSFIEGSETGKITTSENARFIRLSYSLDKIDSVMINKGGKQTTHQEYFNPVDGEKIERNSVPHEKLKGTIPFKKIREYRVISNNLCDPSEKIVGYYVDANDGSLFVASDYITTGFIPAKENTYYTAPFIDNCACYDENGGFLGNYAEYSNHVLKTLPSTAFIRISYLSALDNNFYVNEGQTLEGYDDYAYTLDGFKTTNQRRLYTLGYAWNQWASGKKFPIGILGDSTTDGAGTTGWTTETGHEYLDEQNGGFGSYDYINQNAYPYKLQELIREELNNDVMRVYNIGYSGYSFYTIMEHYGAIFSGAYSDVKMVGINMGINDRIPAVTPDKYYDDFRQHLVETIEYLYERGIQPFIITSQATVEPYPDDSLGTFYPLRTSGNINSIANRVKKEVAHEYGLELLDMTMYDEFIMTYSAHDLSYIIPDKLHYGDLGHTVEAEFLFSEISPRTIKVDEWASLDFSSQRIRSECPSNKVNMSIPGSNAITKSYVSYYQKDATDIVMQDFIINITSKDPLTLKSFCSYVGSQYVLVDGERFNINQTRQEIKTLDVGVHRIKAMSGNTTEVDWIGFRLE